ncbi:hypothetical protein [Candidatus Entotheonella palauensis]|uniref:hypothetical protein n=1 Tax=Candidatus Entotheonella palauensis TaxID=93172 RepID=UPI000B7E293A|nr:hypothetical protein [Candidatus Entotheonella palauensis]
MTMRRGLLNATAFAFAMANVETTIVVYLRRLYYPEGFQFPLVIIDTPTFLLELAREAATVVMLATFGIAAGRTKVGRFGYFMIGFGLWDIFYYVWLKLILNWPASLFTWDVLFLIPVPWLGPVIAPVSVACTLIGMGVVLLILEARGPVRPAGKAVWSAQVIAAAIIIYSFTIDVWPRLDADGTLLSQWVPVTYHWWMLIAGQLLAISTFVVWARKAHQAQMPGVSGI